MDLCGSVQKIIRVAAATGGLLVLACLQAGPANSASNKLFTEKFQTQNQCKNPGGGQVCKVVPTGKWSLQTTFPGTCLVPSDLEPGSGQPVEIFVDDAFDGPTSTASGIDYTDPDVGDDFGIKVFSNKTVATQVQSLRVCNPPATNCKFVNFQKVKLVVNNSGDLTVSINATSGSDYFGDFFDESLDAASFIGESSGAATDTVDFGVSLGCFDSGVLSVAVSGKVKTTAPKNSKPQLSTVNVTGTL